MLQEQGIRIISQDNLVIIIIAKAGGSFLKGFQEEQLEEELLH